MVYKSIPQSHEIGKIKNLGWGPKLHYDSAMHEGKKQFDCKFVIRILKKKLFWTHTLVQFVTERYHLNAVFVARNLQENVPWKYTKAGNGRSHSKSLPRWKMWK